MGEEPGKVSSPWKIPLDGFSSLPHAYALQGIFVGHLGDER